MNKDIILKRITNVLENRYKQKVCLTEILGGRDKNVYLAKLKNYEQFVVLCDKKNSLIHNYRTIQSNYLQKELYKNSVYVAKVMDIFEDDEIGVIACHQYLTGTQSRSLNAEIIKLCAISIAKLHNSDFAFKYYFRDFSYKYAFCGLEKFLNESFRCLRSFLVDKNWSKLKKGVCHHDLNLKNFIFCDNKAYLIDFDRGRYWPYVYEIERFFRNENSREYIKEFISGYESVRKLDKFEQQYLIDRFEELKDIF